MRGAVCIGTGLCVTATPIPSATPTSTPTQTPTPEFPLEAENCIAIGPDGPGAVTTQNLRTGCDENWECARSVDGDTSYVSSPMTTSGARTDLYALDDVVSRPEAIERVVVRMVTRVTSQVSSGTVSAVIRVGNINHPPGSRIQPTTFYAIYSTTYTINPTNGLPWEWSEIDGLEAGIRHEYSGLGEIRTSAVFVHVCWVAPTPTPTSTPTPLPTETFTASPTTTPSPTPSPTPSLTPSASSTPTLSPTDTPVPTVTPSVTRTPTMTRTPSPSPTLSGTPLPTDTPTITSTPLSTTTTTASPTVTTTPLPSPSATASASSTETGTPTGTPTITGTRPTSTPTLPPAIPYNFANSSVPGSTLQWFCAFDLAGNMLISGITRQLTQLANDDPPQARSLYKTVYIAPDMSTADYTTVRGMSSSGGFLDRFASLGGVVIINLAGTRGDQDDIAPGGVGFTSNATHNSEIIQEPDHPYFTGEGYGGQRLSTQDFSSWEPTDWGVLNDLPANATVLLRNTDGPSLAEYPHGQGRVIVSTLSYCWTGRPNSDGVAARNLLRYGIFFTGSGQTPGPTVTPTPTATATASLTQTPMTPRTRTPTPTATPGPGDLNNDGSVDELDALVLIDAMYDDPPEPRADINLDGVVSAADLPALLQLIR